MENCRKKKCSCEDAGIHTLCPNCNPQDCPNPNPCAEMFSDECIIHTGDAIPYYNIESGDSYATILQKIILKESGACVETSVVNLHSTSVTATTIRVAWIIQGTPDSMQLQYSTDNINWLANPAVTPPTYTDIIGPSLIPDTDYYLKVVTTVGQTECDSVVIKVKTNSLT